MKFHFENLGPIKTADIELGGLTVLCGKNNTGKTYLTYGVWGVMGNMSYFWDNLQSEDLTHSLELDKIFQNLLKDKKVILNLNNFISKYATEFQKLFPRYLSKSVFNVHENIFETTKFKWEDPFSKTGYITNINKFLIHGCLCNVKGENQIEITIREEFDEFEEYKKNFLEDLKYCIHELVHLLWDLSMPKPFILSVERSAARLFQIDIDNARSNFLGKLRQRPDADFLEGMSTIPKPIDENISFVRNMPSILNWDSFLSKHHPEIVDYIEDWLNIHYEVVNSILMIRDKKSGTILPAYMASSSIQVLADLHLYLKHSVRENSLLMIDEPELSLHPENQILLARLLVKLVNAGVKVWITTHSDYIVKELNNCIMLSNNFEGKAQMMKDFGYTDLDVLKQEDARFYIAKYDQEIGGCTVENVKIDKYGIQKSAFDEAMIDIDTRTDALFYSIKRNQYQTPSDADLSFVAEPQ